MKLSNMTFAVRPTSNKCRIWENTEGTCSILVYERAETVGSCKMTHVWISAMVQDEFSAGIECAMDGVESFVVREIMEFANKHGCIYPATPFKQALRLFFDQLTPRATLARFQVWKSNQQEGV